MDQFLDRYIFPYTHGLFGWKEKTKDGLPVYSRREERFNSSTHAAGILIGAGMMVASILYARSDIGLAGGIIYSASLMILYAASSLYHGVPLEHVATKKALRVLDHVSIFVLVAGSCSPFLLLLAQKGAGALDWLAYLFVWVVAFAGIVLLCTDLKRFKNIAVVMYVGMGLVPIVQADALVEALGADAVALLVAGGAAYLLGLLFYGLGSKREWMHSVFHVLCLVGSIVHCVCVGCFVI